MKISLLLSLLFFIFFTLHGYLKASPSSSKINVQKLGEEELDQLLASYKGKVLLVNIWATWCKPCKEEFPDLVKLAAHYKDDDVAIITISADYPDEIESRITPFLEKVGAYNLPVYVQDFKKQADFIDRLNPKWRGALPATFIYDKNGKQQVFMLGKENFNRFKEQIEKFRKR